MPPKFNNTENEHIVLDDNRQVWLSRANTVAAQVCLYNQEDHTWSILLNQRGPNTPDCQGMWNFPCGYLDWDETIAQGMIREVFEECGLYLPDLSKAPNFVKANCDCVKTFDCQTTQPWVITDRPKNKQNITFHFDVLVNWKAKPFPELSNAHCEPGEVSDLAWVNIEDAKNKDLAFNHNQKLLDLLNKKADAFQQIERL